MADLLTRIFIHFRTSLDGLALTIIAWLSASGIELSADNKGKITAIAALIAAAVWKFFSKDPEPAKEGVQ